MAVALGNMILFYGWLMLPKYMRGKVRSQEDETKLMGKAREMKAVVNVAAVYIQVRLANFVNI